MIIHTPRIHPIPLEFCDPAHAAPSPSSGNPPIADPILIHYQEWLEARAELQKLFEASGDLKINPEMRAVEAREDAALNAMVELTPQSFYGMAALLHAIWYFEVPEVDSNQLDYADRCKDPVHKALINLWRAVTGGSGIPGIN